MGQRERDEELTRITKDTDEPMFVIPVNSQPIPAEIVRDSRDGWGRRVPIIALILIMLYFSIGGQVQSAQNGAQLTKSLNAQQQLLHTVHRDETYVILASQYIQLLRHAHKVQNRRLEAHGIKPVPLPPPPQPPSVPHQARQISKGESPSPQPHPSASGHSHPSPHPTHSPQPRPSPSNSPTPPPIVCVDVPIVGHRCVPPTLFIGVIYVIIR